MIKVAIKATTENIIASKISTKISKITWWVTGKTSAAISKLTAVNRPKVIIVHTKVIPDHKLRLSWVKTQRNVPNASKNKTNTIENDKTTYHFTTLIYYTYSLCLVFS